MKKLILILLSLVFLSGCVLLEQQKVETVIIKKPTNGDMRLASFPTQLRAVYYNANGISCAEPVPDVAVSVDTDLKLLDGKGLKSKTAITKLDGRDSTVLITRELLFRICEMGLNYEDTDGTRTQDLYTKVLEVVKIIAQIEDAKAEVVNAEIKKIFISTIQTQLKDPKLKPADKKVFIQRIKGFDIKNLLPK